MDRPPPQPPFPTFGEPLPLAGPNEALLAFLARRRSTPAAQLSAPGPTPEQVDTLIALAARTPDHGKLAPWRFIVFEGSARETAGAALAARLAELEPDAPPERRALEQGRFTRAPVVIAVVSAARENHKIPEWEQILSAGAACQNLLIAAGAMGFAAQWLTEWCAYDGPIRAVFGLRPGERIAGYVYLGAAREPARERARPDAHALTTRWRG